MGLILWKIMSPSPEPMSLNLKKNESKIENAWDGYVTRQLIWRQTSKLCITVHWN